MHKNCFFFTLFSLSITSIFIRAGEQTRYHEQQLKQNANKAFVCAAISACGASLFSDFNKIAFFKQLKRSPNEPTSSCFFLLTSAKAVSLLTTVYYGYDLFTWRSEYLRVKCESLK